MTYADKSYYLGNWLDDKRSGFSLKMKYANGDYYRGSWLGDKRNGQGKLFDKNENLILEGIWKDDTFVKPTGSLPEQTENPLSVSQ